MRPDSMGQWHQASLGFFSDHHPPLMAVWWSCLNFIYPTPGLMLLMHLFLLYVAVFIFSLTFRRSSWQYFYVLSVGWPQILFYSAFILKDIGFTFSFLCAASLLTFYSVHQHRLPWKIIILISLLLFYGTAVKFQAMFILPVMTYWVASCSHLSSSFLKKVINASLLFIIIFGSVYFFNTAMTDKKEHSWQYVKIYDLVAIGLQENKDLLPSFVKRDSFYSKKDIKDKFNSERVDPLVFDKNSPLIKGKSKDERDIVWKTWAKSVLECPRAYLIHRGNVFYNLISKPLIKSSKAMQSDPDLLPPQAKTVLLFAESWGIVNILEFLSPFKFYLPFLLLYFLVGVVYRKKVIYAMPLAFLNGAALLLFMTLFIFSMASEGRYIYLPVCFFHFSHPFFFKTLLNLKKRYSYEDRINLFSISGKAYYRV